MGTLQMRKRDTSGFTDMLPDYKRMNAAGKPQKNLGRNLVAAAAVCLVVFLFVRASSWGANSPAKARGPRGFTSAAGFEAEARHKQNLLQQQGSNVQDDGSLIVDTSHSTHFAHDIKPAEAMDRSSLEGEHAPKFVGGDLVDPVDTASAGAASAGAAAAGSVDKSHPHGVYSLTATDIDGHERSLLEFTGKVTVFVNVASKCGYTDANYKGLQTMYEKYQSSGLEILAFPSNQFGSQEPGTDAEIKQFATGQYHTTFPMFHKVDVNGANAHPVYKYLKEQLHIQDPPGLAWNFQKILVNRAGKPVLLLQQDWDQGRVEHAVYNLLTSAAVH